MITFQKLNLKEQSGIFVFNAPGRQKWLSLEGLLQEAPVWHLRVMRAANECST